MEPERKETDLFAAKTETGFRHFYPTASVIKSLCLSPNSTTPVVAVKVVEDPNGDYFAWWSAQRQSFSMVYDSKMLVEICFPYGSEAAEKAGDGKVYAVRVEPRMPP